MVVTEEIKNLRRLEAQRNELNAKGRYTVHVCIILFFTLHGSSCYRGHDSTQATPPQGSDPFLATLCITGTDG